MYNMLSRSCEGIFFMQAWVYIERYPSLMCNQNVHLLSPFSSKSSLSPLLHRGAHSVKLDQFCKLQPIGDDRTPQHPIYEKNIPNCMFWELFVKARRREPFWTSGCKTWWQLFVKVWSWIPIIKFFRRHKHIFIPLRIFPQLYDVVKNSALPVGIVSELFCQRRSHQTLKSSVTGS